nr:IncF plasmid conjugative transfer pilus assembly protein TraB [Escherichia coli]
MFTRTRETGPSLPYIPSGSFAKAMLIEGAMPALSPVRIHGADAAAHHRPEMPNSKTYDVTDVLWSGSLGMWSSERAIVRTRNIRLPEGWQTIDMPGLRAVSSAKRYQGRSGDNGKILIGMGAGFVDGIGQE